MIATVVRVAIDIYLYSLLASLVLFFVKKKREALVEQMLQLTTFNIFIISWSVLLIFLNMIYRIIITIQFASIV